MDDAVMPRRPYLTTRAHKAFAIAHSLAEQAGHGEVSPVHLAISAIRQRGVESGALQSLGISLVDLESDLTKELPPAGAASVNPGRREWSSGDEEMIRLAREEATELGTEQYSTEHLLLAMIRDATTSPARVLAKHGVRHETLRREVLRIYRLPG